MANPHFANLGDVWKHLLLTEAIGRLRPADYVETHAGSSSYALAHDLERGLGAQMFLSASSEVEPLRSSTYRRHMLALAHGAVPSYPGSPLLAMMLLGHACRYVFCDTDSSSVADLRAARERLGLGEEVRVIHGDGLAETTALLHARALSAASLVHVDPFDFRAAGPGGASPLELVSRLAAASIPTFAWYGLTARSATHEMVREVTTAAPTARVWCAELRVGGQRAARRASAQAAASCSQPGIWLRSSRCGGPQTPTLADSTSAASQPIRASTSRPVSSRPGPAPAEALS